MTTVTISAGGREYKLTDEHSTSNYGQPVLLDQDGASFGPWENVIDNPNAKMSGGETYISQITARAIAAYARDDNPGNAEVLDLVKRFEAIQEPPRRGRKPLPDDARKDARVELRVHPSTKATWQAKADTAGLSLAAWIEATLSAAKK